MLATLATYGTIAIASPSGGGSDAKAAGPSALQEDFASAAQEFGVPQSVLMAVSYRQTLWDAHGGQPSATGNYNVMGLTSVRAQDLEQPTDAERLAEMNLSGDPVVSKHFNAARALKSDPAKVNPDDPRLHTLDDAAKLIGASAEDLRTDSRQSVRGAAALLAQWEKEAYGSLPADAGRWYPAVARYSQSPDASAADRFAQHVFASIRSGEARVTDEGQQVVLAADPSVKAVKVGKSALTVKPADATATVTADCPTTLTCAWVPAAFKRNSTPATDDDFGNYNPANRVPGPPAAGAEDIRYIVIHDMEGTYEGSIQEFQDSTRYASAHYLVADDGRVTQMVQNKDEAWHAANKTVNMHSIGVEHEGFAMKAGSWYTEQEYETSATLVKYLAAKYHVPLDRQHIIGHDEVPGVLDSLVASQHWDPGPFWDWNHYMALLGVPQGDQGAGGVLKTGQLVRIVPPFTTANQPTLTNGGAAFGAHPANFVYLYTSASTSGAKNTDPYLGSPLWSDGSNWADKALTGSEYVVAGTSGNDWTAIWYGGKKLWFYNPGGQWTAPVGTTGQPVIAPKVGATTIPVYGRAYPEDAAYAPKNVPVQVPNVQALSKYTIGTGQAYAIAGPEAAGDYYFAGTYPGTAANDRTLVSGTTMYYPIEYNHRIAWVMASDVRVLNSTVPDLGATRSDLMVRDASGNLWQYQGTGKSSAPFLGRYWVGPGWNTYNQVTRMSVLRGNGTGDMVGRDATGTLWYYTGSGNINKPFTGRSKVGTGWNQYNLILGGGDLNGDGKADLVVRDSTGTLYYHPGANTATHLSARTKIGTGWNQYNMLVSPGDMTGDGHADLLARDSSGTLWLYRGTGNPTAPYLARTKAGTGWQSYTKIIGAGDITGDGKPDILARDSAGKLYVHPGTGSATAPYGARLTIGSGWNQYNLFS